MINRRYYLVAILWTFIMAGACDEWDDHNKPNDPTLNENLLQAVNKDPQLTTFSQYLTATGYDQVLASSKTFTVWALDNDALASLSPDITNDPEELTLFIGNHISYQEYFTASAKPSVRVKMINGKSLTWDGDFLELAAVKSADRPARNGVLHIIDSPVLPRKNTWDVLNSSSAGQLHSAYLQSLTYQQFVDSLATQIGIDPATGRPIYEPGTGNVTRNRFKDEVYDISSEDSLCTFIVLTDDAFNAELTKLKPYFRTITLNQDSTNALASWHLAKDLVFKGRINPEALPDTLVSLYGVKVPIDKSAILETQLTSNGIVYVMNKVDFRLKHKFPPIILEGEHPDGFSRTDKDVNIHYRYRDWAQGDFDLRVWNHGISQINVRYKINGLQAMTYRVYWRAVNDFVDTTSTTATSNVAAFQQKLVLESRNTYVPITPPPGAPLPRDFGYVKVNRIKANPANNGLRLLGTYSHANYRLLYLFVVANNVTTPNTLNPIEVDYIKLVPVF
jgi:hypothetical protein